METGGSDAATRQGTGPLEVPEARNSKEGHFPRALREDVPADPLMSKVCPPKQREQTAIVKRHPVCGNLL